MLRTLITVITISSGAQHPSDTADVEVLWQDERLGAPVTLASLSTGFVVADRTSLHFLDPQGKYLSSAGRSGGGPGEFREIRVLGTRGDTAFVVSGQRLSLFGADGTFLTSRESITLAGFPGKPRNFHRLGFRDAGVLFVAEELAGSLQRRALVWAAIEEDSIEVLRTVAHQEWIQAPGTVFAAKDPFGQRAHFAFGPDGLVAWSDGHDECITVGLEVQHRWCANWPAVPVTAASRRPDLRGLSNSRRQMMQGVLDAQEPGEVWPRYDRLVFGRQGRLWVRVIDDRFQDLHPYLTTDFPEKQPPYMRWDWFAVTGELGGTVEFPRAYTPVLFEATAAVGFLELATGEVVVARATWPAA